MSVLAWSPVLREHPKALKSQGILAIWNDCVAGREAEFESWFQGEHLIERLAVPGFLYGRRHEALSGTPRFFVFYVARSPRTLVSVPYMERLNNPTPLTRTVMAEIFRNMTRTVCRRTARIGSFRGSTAVTLRFEALPPEPEWSTAIEALAANSAVACAEFWHAAEPEAPPMTAEEHLRDGDRRISGCLMAETLRPRDAEGLATTLSKQFPAADVGIYQVLCQIGRSDI